jgi:hypothetical protein
MARKLVQTEHYFVQKAFDVDSVTLTPIVLVDQDAIELHIRNSSPIIGFWIYTDELDEDTKEYVYPGSIKSFSDPGFPNYPPPFRADTPRIWVKVDSGVGPINTTWRVVTKYVPY